VVPQLAACVFGCCLVGRLGPGLWGQKKVHIVLEREKVRSSVVSNQSKRNDKSSWLRQEEHSEIIFVHHPRVWWPEAGRLLFHLLYLLENTASVLGFSKLTWKSV
jgi:hypothetical protein